MRKAAMLEGKEAIALGIASTGMLLFLIKRLVAEKVITQLQAEAILGETAEELEKSSGQGHVKAAKMIRTELVSII